MLYETNYLFGDLQIDLGHMYQMLGFPDGLLPEPFNWYVEQALEEAESLCSIQGAFTIRDDMEFSGGKAHVLVNNTVFGIGKTVARELRHSTSLAFFICTAGEGISRRSQELLLGENPVLGYVFDLLGSMVVESATDRLQSEIKQLAQSQGMAITNRYSPGYCNWSVSDQHKLFSLFPSGCCGIRLTDSALMHPVKSVSGIIGIGQDVAFRNYFCNLCTQENCFYRNHHNVVR